MYQSDKNFCYYCCNAQEVLVYDELFGTQLKSCPSCSPGVRGRHVPKTKEEMKAIMDHCVAVGLESYAKAQQRRNQYAKSN